jgi:hypothetical protein
VAFCMRYAGFLVLQEWLVNMEVLPLEKENEYRIMVARCLGFW